MHKPSRTSPKIPRNAKLPTEDGSVAGNRKSRPKTDEEVLLAELTVELRKKLAEARASLQDGLKESDAVIAELAAAKRTRKRKN